MEQESISLEEIWAREADLEIIIISIFLYKDEIPQEVCVEWRS